MPVQYLPRADLPSPLLRALSSEEYQQGLDDHFASIPEDIRGQFTHSFSVTTLPRAPRQRVLFARHSHRVYVDPLSDLPKMHGKVIHTILEKYADPGDIVETRLGTLVPIPGMGNVYVHGQGDRYVPSERLLQDWKFTSVWSVIRGVSKGYEAQLNILRWLWSLQGGDPIEKQEDVFIFKDWRASDVDRIANYPKEPVMIVPAPMWSTEEIVQYVKDRVQLHVTADRTEDAQLPFCSDEERWMEKPVYKVFKIEPKTGQIQKVTKHNSPTPEGAETWIAEHPTDAKGNQIKYQIIEKKGQPKFCSYCDIRNFCSQRMAEVQEQGLDNQPEIEE